VVSGIALRLLRQTRGTQPGVWSVQIATCDGKPLEDVGLRLEDLPTMFSPDANVGACLEFDGKRGQVLIPAEYSYHNLKRFSLSAWVKLTSMPEQGNGHTIVNKGPVAHVPFGPVVLVPQRTHVRVGGDDHRPGNLGGR
jgi:hypothetical protein